MQLSDRIWKEFSLGDAKYFILKRGESQYLKNLGTGFIPYVSTTQRNNGITAYTEACNRKGNLISLAYDGSIGSCFYQAQPFFASEKIVTIDLVQVELNEKLALFLIPIFKLEAELYLYGGRKWSVNQCLINTKIKLPVGADGEPDYQFMEDFIKSQNGDVSSIPDYFMNEGYDKACWYIDNIDVEKFENEYAGKKEEKDIKLLDSTFKNFKIESLFGGKNIYKSASYSNEQVTDSVDDDYLCYVTRSDNNNGIMRYVVNDTETFEKGNCITIGDTTATCFYQEHDFVNGDHIIVMRADWLNKYVGQFIVTLLNFEKFRYPPFGRAFLKDCVKNTELQLPIKLNDDGTPFIDETKKYSVDGYVPDWQFMEDYIKSLPFSCKL